MKAVTCPDCKREHALFYYVDAAGEKTLNFLCNRKERFTVEKRGVAVPAAGYWWVTMEVSDERP